MYGNKDHKQTNSENMDNLNDSDMLSAGCAPASLSLSGVESVEKSSEQEIIGQKQS